MINKQPDTLSRSRARGQRLTQLVRSIPPWGEFAIVVGICWGWPVLRSVAIKGGLEAIPVFNDTHFLRVIAAEVLVGGIFYRFLRLRGWSYGDFLPDINWTSSAAGILLFLVAFLLHLVAVDVGRLWLGGSMEPLVELSRAVSVSFPVAIAASAVNGVFEELVLVAYVFRSLEHHGTGFVIGVSALMRMLAHVYQGPVGALSLLVAGVFFGLVYARYRQLWPLMFAHILVDILYFVH